MDKILGLIRLDALKGKRTQITIILMGIINILVNLGVLHLDANGLKQINEALTFVATYFFAEKVSK